jgi:hypothetical protein
VFWLAFGLSWILSPGGSARLASIRAWLAGTDTLVQVIVLIGGLAVIAASGAAVQGVSAQVIRALEGYWPKWLSPIRGRLIERAWRRYQRLDRERQDLEEDRERWSAARSEPVISTGGPAAPGGEAREGRAVREGWAGVQRDAARAASLDARLAWMPSSYQRFKPTLLGNVLAAAEERPLGKYRLDAVTCWPALWLLLADDQRKEIAAARRSLDGGAAMVIWGLLGVTLGAFWLPRPWVAALIAAAGIATALGAYGRLHVAARDYGTLIDAAFDLRRRDLLTALGTAPAGHPGQEKPYGEAVTHFLRSGEWVSPGAQVTAP